LKVHKSILQQIFTAYLDVGQGVGKIVSAMKQCGRDRLLFKELIQISEMIRDDVRCNCHAILTRSTFLQKNV